MEYSIDRVLSGPFEEALTRVKDALKAEGFGTLSEIDVKATLHEKIGKEMPPYTILGVCNPQLASRAIDTNPKIGVFLPCTVLVREVGDHVQVCAQDPILMESMLEEDALAPISVEARNGIVRALDKL